jgi:transcriptional regulator of heat shock response
MNERQSLLLVAIIDEFIRSAEPVGSKQILAAGRFQVSGATIRNEMRSLSEAGFIEQPHTSAGRIPTAKGYRMYVKEHLQPSSYEKLVRQRFNALQEQYNRRKDQERAYDAVAMLAHMTPNVAFSSVPHKHRVYYLGLHNILRQPEFMTEPGLACSIAEMLEERFSQVIAGLEIDDRVRYYIGDEHVLPTVQSCSLLLTRYTLRGEHGAIGILGPMRMDYAYNTVALGLAADFLRSS